MTSDRLVFSEDVARDLTGYCIEHALDCVVTVSDSNTFTVIGDEINTRLNAGGITVKSIILNGNQLMSDERAIVSVLVDMNLRAKAIIAVGSGTITDIVRFVSHRTNTVFIAVPTAPSVDGYASSGAPLVLKGYKRSIQCHAPAFILASLPILANSPRAMIAAGFGDVLGKVTALADWELSHILIGTRYDAEIARDTHDAYDCTIGNVRGIASQDPAAIKVLFQALTTTGMSVARFGSSEPASGAEHHISHFIEMQQMVDGKPAILHGTKVAMGTVIAAHWYKTLRNWNRAEIRDLPVAVPDYESDSVEIRRLLGEAGERILESNSFLSTLTRRQVETIRARLLENWDRIQDIARRVPPPEELQQLLDIVGSPHDPGALGLTAEQVATASRLCHFVRSRMTVRTLFFVLGIPAETVHGSR